MTQAILDSTNLQSQLNRYQAKLWPFAYNILGDSLAAEDVVQDILNDYFLGLNKNIHSPESYLTRAVINRSINQKKLLRTQNEDYRGHWLPTPVATEEEIYANADQKKILNYSLLVLLENLSIKERAVFILKETFDFSHPDIAQTLDITVDHSRQLLKRAKSKVEPNLKSHENHSSNLEMLQELTKAISTRDVDKLKKLLSKEVKSISDGGTKQRAAQKILLGQERVYKFLYAIYNKYMPEGAEWKFTLVNHKPAILFSIADQIFRCIIFEVVNNRIQDVFIVVNPDKLKRLNFS